MLSLWDINLFLHLIYRTCRIIRTLLCMSSRHFWIIAGRHRACKGTSSSDYSTSIINQNVCRFLNIKLTENWYALHVYANFLLNCFEFFSKQLVAVYSVMLWIFKSVQSLSHGIVYWVFCFRKKSLRNYANCLQKVMFAIHVYYTVNLCSTKLWNRVIKLRLLAEKKNRDLCLDVWWKVILFWALYMQSLMVSDLEYFNVIWNILGLYLFDFLHLDQV